GEEGAYKDWDASPASVIREGSDVTLVAYGIMLNNVIAAADLLKKEGISAEVVRLGRILPLDPAPALVSLEKTRRLVVAEDVCAGGCVGERLLAAAAGRFTFKPLLLNLGDGIVVQGSVPELQAHCGLDAGSIAEGARRLVSGGVSDG
ncbi:MAG TPA: 1-deoxy-D-xylulose-5-phosphate synthase, partial [Clostridiales bacterium]|nr:1-deoxy-D-xylulose-5-phosphate synthase [Clostridiales bacterium]